MAAGKPCSVAVDRSGGVWHLGENRHLYKLDAAGSWRDQTGGVLALAADKAGGLYLQTNNRHLYKLDDAAGRWSYQFGGVVALASDAAGNLWHLGENRHLYKMADSGDFQDVRGGVVALAADEAGNLWHLRENRHLYKLTGDWYDQAGGIVALVSDAAGNLLRVGTNDTVSQLQSGGTWGTVAQSHRSSDLVHALRAEMAAWDGRRRDPFLTANHWRSVLAPSKVAASIMALSEDALDHSKPSPT